jgi:hypothetical protein
MTALGTASIIVVAISAWLSVWMVIPSCARSLFRYRLWRLHDALIDDFRGKHFTDEQQPRLLLREIDAAIAVAGELSLFRLFLVALKARRLLPMVDPDEWFDPEKAHPKDRDLVAERYGELQFALRKHVLIGAPSGWVFLILIFPLALIVTVIQMSRHLVLRDVFRETKSRVRNEVPDPQPALALLGTRADRHHRELSSYA